MLGLFMRFFPVDTFERRFQEVAAHYARTRTTRHNVTFSRGVFLRFLGLIVRMCTHPLPNIEWHWRWPDSLPDTM